MLTVPVAGVARQQWVVETWGATWRLRPLNCPGRYLAIAKACGEVEATVQAQGPNYWNAFSLLRVADGALVVPPKEENPGPAAARALAAAAAPALATAAGAAAHQPPPPHPQQ